MLANKSQLTAKPKWLKFGHKTLKAFFISLQNLIRFQGCRWLKCWNLLKSPYGIFMRSLYDVHGLDVYRTDHVSLSDNKFRIEQTTFLLSRI